MLDFGWTELLMIGVVAVIVIGPKDLPKAMADLAGWIKKLRGMASDFQGQVNDMVKGTELEEVQKAARGLNQYNVKRQISKTIDPKGQMKKALDETRQAANAKVDAPEPTPADAKPALASASGMVEAQPENAIGGGDSGAALAVNSAAVKAMSGEAAAVEAATEPAAQPAAKPAKRKAGGAAAKPGKSTAGKSTAAKSSSTASGTAKKTAAKTSGAKTPAAKAGARKSGAKPAAKATTKSTAKAAAGQANGAAKPAKTTASGAAPAKRKTAAKPKAPAKPAAAAGDAAQTSE